MPARRARSIVKRSKPSKSASLSAVIIKFQNQCVERWKLLFVFPAGGSRAEPPPAGLFRVKFKARVGASCVRFPTKRPTLPLPKTRAFFSSLFLLLSPLLLSIISSSLRFLYCNKKLATQHKLCYNTTRLPSRLGATFSIWRRVRGDLNSKPRLISPLNSPLMVLLNGAKLGAAQRILVSIFCHNTLFV